MASIQFQIKHTEYGCRGSRGKTTTLTLYSDSFKHFFQEALLEVLDNINEDLRDNELYHHYQTQIKKFAEAFEFYPLDRAVEEIREMVMNDRYYSAINPMSGSVSI